MDQAQALADFSMMTFLLGFLVGSMSTIIILLCFEAIKAFNAEKKAPAKASPKPAAKKSKSKKK